jgi:hypothetical protein
VDGKRTGESVKKTSCEWTVAIVEWAALDTYRTRRIGAKREGSLAAAKAK